MKLRKLNKTKCDRIIENAFELNNNNDLLKCGKYSEILSLLVDMFNLLEQNGLLKDK